MSWNTLLNPLTDDEILETFDLIQVSLDFFPLRPWSFPRKFDDFYGLNASDGSYGRVHPDILASLNRYLQEIIEIPLKHPVSHVAGSLKGSGRTLQANAFGAGLFRLNSWL